MAVNYTIATASDLSPSAVRESLARLPDFAQEDGRLTAPDLFISIWEPNELSSEIIEEAFAFRPRLEIDFRIHNLGDGPAAVDRMLRATASILRSTEADTSLLFNGEEVVLTRRQGRLLLYSRPGFWTDARVKLMPEPNSFTAPVLL